MKLKGLLVCLIICLSAIGLASCGKKGDTSTSDKINVVNGKLYYCETLKTEEEPVSEFYSIKFNTSNNTCVINTYKEDGKTIDSTVKQKYEVSGKVDQYIEVKIYYDETNFSLFYFTDDFKFIEECALSLPKDNVVYKYKNDDNIEFSLTFDTEKKEFKINFTENDEEINETGSYKINYIAEKQLDIDLIGTERRYNIRILRETITELLILAL